MINRTVRFARVCPFFAPCHVLALALHAPLLRPMVEEDLSVVGTDCARACGLRPGAQRRSPQEAERMAQFVQESPRPAPPVRSPQPGPASPPLRTGLPAP